MTDAREFTDANGVQWRAEIITRGRTSGYLNPRVHKPIVQFTCLSVRKPRRYASLVEDDSASLTRLSASELGELFERAQAH